MKRSMETRTRTAEIALAGLVRRNDVAGGFALGNRDQRDFAGLPAGPLRRHGNSFA
jgi:hypothetical protein